MSPDDVTDTTTLSALGALIKRRHIAMEVSYGSGGFSVILKSKGHSVYACSWDISDALQKSLQELNKSEMNNMLQDYTASDEDDMPTKPDMRLDEVLKKD